jgi:hypothetical protein
MPQETLATCRCRNWSNDLTYGGGGGENDDDDDDDDDDHQHASANNPAIFTVMF